MVFREPNAAAHILKSLQEEELRIKAVLAIPRDIRMTQEDWGGGGRWLQHGHYLPHVSEAAEYRLYAITATPQGGTEALPTMIVT